MAMRDRRFAAALIAPWILAFATLAVRAQETNCARCVPEHLSASYPSTMPVCVDDQSSPYDLGSTKEADLRNGLENYWEGYFDEAGIGIDISVTTSSSCPSNSVKVTVVGAGSMNDPDKVAENDGNSPPTIKINQNYLSDGSVSWARVGGHEMGHVFGFEEVTDGSCYNETIMAGTAYDGYPSSIGCSDKTVATRQFLST